MASYDGTFVMPWIATWPVMSFVTARSTPASAKNVPSVTMKLGSPVFITRKPLSAPTARAAARETSTATQMLSP